MSWSEKEKYNYWKTKKYKADDMTSDEKRWFENMEKKYNPQNQVKKIKKQISKDKKQIRKSFGAGRKGRNILDKIFGA